MHSWIHSGCVAWHLHSNRTVYVAFEVRTIGRSSAVTGYCVLWLRHRYIIASEQNMWNILNTFMCVNVRTIWSELLTVPWSLKQNRPKSPSWLGYRQRSLMPHEGRHVAWPAAALHKYCMWGTSCHNTECMKWISLWEKNGIKNYWRSYGWKATKANEAKEYFRKVNRGRPFITEARWTEVGRSLPRPGAI